ncbi:hypothetical protein QBC40DRAFT_283566 [Triangularia verruculosa]|uniref:2EXR domain-containing protein n=1 Tax=Triangularia verruculosa TaxID=2587418 RepID=A0AAN6XD67_9PEZI|nr:hypothetical protein QBC40DRAFT_283566 [Triangularia verruculosa]
MSLLWYNRGEEKTRLWLEFQVVHDGLDGGSSKDPENQPPAQTFTCFGELPPEIRLQIWEVLIQPRIVLAACVDNRSKTQKHTQMAKRSTKRSIPVLLHVNHESRTLALRHYELTFAWKIPPRLAAPETSVLPAQGDARVWFNYSLDALLLLGELEPYDEFGFSSPMSHFFRKEDTSRLKHIACAFEELHLSLYEADSIFGTLFHIIDRCPAARRLLITTTNADTEARHLRLPTLDNVVQKLWRAFLNDTTCVNESLANMQILMISEDSLASFINYHR